MRNETSLSSEVGQSNFFYTRYRSFPVSTLHVVFRLLYLVTYIRLSYLQFSLSRYTRIRLERRSTLPTPWHPRFLRSRSSSISNSSEDEYEDHGTRSLRNLVWEFKDIIHRNSPQKKEEEEEASEGDQMIDEGWRLSHIKKSTWCTMMFYVHTDGRKRNQIRKWFDLNKKSKTWKSNSETPDIYAFTATTWWTCLKSTFPSRQCFKKIFGFLLEISVWKNFCTVFQL